MMVLQWWNKDGSTGRCDGRCYDLVYRKENSDLPPNCQCVCAGNNHGKGKRAAILRTRAEGVQWMANRPEVVRWTANPLVANNHATNWGKDDPRYFETLAVNKRYPLKEENDGNESSGL